MRNLYLIFIALTTHFFAYSQNSENMFQERTALLIVDIQNDYFTNGACELVGSEQASEIAKLVLNHFRETKQPVIHIQHISAGAGATFFLPNTSGAEINANVSPVEGEKVIIKGYPNSFRETGLLKELQELNISELVIIDMMTHMCIDTTTRAAKDYGFNCTVISDACATKDLISNGTKVNAKDVHNAFLLALNGFYAQVIDSQSFLK